MNIPSKLEGVYNVILSGRKTADKTAFPIATDYSVTRMVNAFRTLADTYGQADKENQVAEASSEEIKEVVREAKRRKGKNAGGIRLIKTLFLRR